MLADDDGAADSTSRRLYYGWARRTLASSSSAALVSVAMFLFKNIRTCAKAPLIIAHCEAYVRCGPARLPRPGGTGQMIQALKEDKIDIVRSSISPCLSLSLFRVLILPGTCQTDPCHRACNSNTPPFDNTTSSLSP